MNNIQYPDQYAATLNKLAKLSRNHLLFFRLEVGKLLLSEFFDGDPAAYSSKDSNKPQSFNNFVATCSQHLSDIGLSDQLARQCIVAHLVMLTLPPVTADKLQLSHVLELTKVEDVATRGVLAHAVADNHWTTKELKGAVEAARAGKWIDGDLKKPGIQPPEPTPKQEPQYSAENRPQAGRVVARFERVLAEFEEVAGQWDLVDAGKVTEGQMGRVAIVVKGLEGRLGVVKSKVG